MDGHSFLGSLVKIGLKFLAASPQLQAETKLALAESLGQLKGDLSDMQGLPPDWKQLLQVLIHARNQRLLEDLKDEMAQVPPSGSIAVFYGAAHMDDIQSHLTNDLHYRAAEGAGCPPSPWI